MRLHLPLCLLLAACNGGDPQPSDAAPPDRPGPDAPAADQAAVDLGLDLVPTPDLPPPDAPCVDPGVALVDGIVISPTNLTPGGQATFRYKAALAGSPNLTLHYGFNFWDLTLTGGAAIDAPMSKNADGSFEVTIALPPGARLLDFVFFTESSGNKQWDNNSNKDYHRAIAVPLIGPYLTLRDNVASPKQPDRDPAHSIMVSFVSDRPCLGAVRFHTPGAALSGSVTESAAGTHHHLRLTGLAADTLYKYKVSCRDPAAACPVPETAPYFAFRTGRKNPPGLTLLVLSDPQNYRSPGDKWQDLAAMLAQPPHDDVQLVVLAGDLTGDDLPARWWDFFDMGRPLLATRPIVPAVGNHDTPTYYSNADTSSFDALFDFDSSFGSDAAHGLVYGPLSLLVLNSETSQVAPGDWKPGGSQYGWVQSTLPKLTTPWRFAVWHIPPYNAGLRHSSQSGGTRPMTALLNDAVDWVLSGHEHLYQRFKPLRFVSDSAPAQVASSYGPGGGVGYLIAPAAGHDPPEDGLLPSSNPARGLLASPTPAEITGDTLTSKWVGFVKIKLGSKTFELKAHALGEAAPRDQLSYIKP